MKKSRILLISLLGMFLFVPLSNYSTAAPSAYIGVQEGEEYTWTLKVNVGGYTSLVTDMGENVSGEISLFESMPSVQMKGVIEYISDEYSGIVYDYTLINISIYMNVPGYGWQSPMPPGEYLPILVLNNGTSNYFNDTINALETESLDFVLPFMIVPQTLDWTGAVNGLSSLIDSFTGGATGVTIEQNGNGFKVTVPSQTINGTVMKQMQLTAQWNSKGVFDQGEMKYGGTNVMSINAPSSEEIPGFEVITLIGVVGLSTAGIIYYIKKKK